MAAEEQPKGGTAVSSGEAIAAGSATGNGSEKPVAIPATSTENRRAEDMSESKNQGDIQGELGKSPRWTSGEEMLKGDVTELAPNGRHSQAGARFRYCNQPSGCSSRRVYASAAL